MEKVVELRMRMPINLNFLFVRALFFVYLYGLYKIILLKFREPDIAFLREMLQTNLSHPKSIVASMQAGNLVPLKEISRTLQTMTEHGFTNLIGNIAIFVPLGLFLGALWKKQSFVRVFWQSLVLSLGLEFTQAVLSIGNFDVDDLMLNTIGGVIGYFVYKLLNIQHESEKEKRSYDHPVNCG